MCINSSDSSFHFVSFHLKSNKHNFVKFSMLLLVFAHLRLRNCSFLRLNCAVSFLVVVGTLTESPSKITPILRIMVKEIV